MENNKILTTIFKVRALSINQFDEIIAQLKKEEFIQNNRFEVDGSGKIFQKDYRNGSNMDVWFICIESENGINEYYILDNTQINLKQYQKLFKFAIEISYPGFLTRFYDYAIKKNESSFSSENGYQEKLKNVIADCFKDSLNDYNIGIYCDESLNKLMNILKITFNKEDLYSEKIKTENDLFNWIIKNYSNWGIFL